MRTKLAHFLEHMAFNGTTIFPGVGDVYLRGKVFSRLTPDWHQSNRV